MMPSPGITAVVPSVAAVLDPAARWVQFTEPLPEWQHRELGRWLAEHRGTGLRVYGNYRGGLDDLEFLRHYPRVAGFALDTMHGEAPDLSGLRHLPDDLEQLTLGVPSGEHGETLLARTTGLRLLMIAAHKRLPAAMTGLRHLTTLLIEGPVKDIDGVSALTSVEKLTLRSVTLPDLSALLPLRSLTSLELKLGGTRDLALLPQLGPITYLEIWLIRGLSDLSMLQDVITLERLGLEALRNVTELPDLSRLTRLTNVSLRNMKGLTDLSALATAPALQHLWLWESPNLQPEAVLPLVGHPSLKTAHLGIGGAKKRAAAQALLRLPPE
jgi:hypothetical protein